MTVLDSVLLGALQGLTEFLPVSSSGHLFLLERLLGVEGSTLSFNVAAHVGTLFAVVVALRGEVAWLLRGLASGSREAARLFLAVVVGSLPAAVAGLLLSDFVDAFFRPASAGALALVGAGLLFTALWLTAAERLRRPAATGGNPPGPGRALLIGVAQAAALLPGISRSGMTIGAGVFAGMGRVDAARFSFLLAIPVIAGAGALEVPGLVLEGGGLGPAAAGALAAAVTGFFAIRFFLALARRTSVVGYAVYCALVGATSLGWAAVSLLAVDGGGG